MKGSLKTEALFDTYIILYARFEVSKEGERFVILHLTELHRSAAEIVVQLRGKYGCCTTLVLWALITCKKISSEKGERGIWDANCLKPENMQVPSAEPQTVPEVIIHSESSPEFQTDLSHLLN